MFPRMYLKCMSPAEKRKVRKALFKENPSHKWQTRHFRWGNMVTVTFSSSSLVSCLYISPTPADSTDYNKDWKKKTTAHIVQLLSSVIFTLASSSATCPESTSVFKTFRSKKVSFGEQNCCIIMWKYFKETHLAVCHRHFFRWSHYFFGRDLYERKRTAY